ncbi:MAG: hypothetical protein UX02_C0001G0148 [Candidatus Moranbacteria bacterium GW2011_GWC1_45_18]|nr:MAG: hypothetical protein UT79_C0002G0249 [Candidatus Moranbacteria bacterium GW2011_GWC2_40_12]KKT32889.1 MAG: hypothetical protein UW19_C0014G0026 [Candidatus Moranbacteria bacterium GW2011_GWF2_44_10]KKU00700.1 MAG: hypothetical protein UX02_C0001G0148 [Candidatus Moranbacteria bacterium GW2011_GWC1_45_18]OGI36331.1 MAG: hypothetical protein A2407_01595 [Candidatus Moranbacteria bacterium RIFOXYC1_FULL_44_8]OGI40414.1 MAG: hypothetical protein A2374_03710 [Candidatus Moranbacteria bacteri
MKTLKPWQKWVLRSAVWIRVVIVAVSVAAADVSGMLLLYKLTLSNKELSEQAAVGSLLASLSLDQYLIYWLIPLFTLSFFLLIKSIALITEKENLPEVVAQNAQAIIKERPEFADILDPLVQDTLTTDDGGRLAEKLCKIREVLRLKERLVCEKEDLTNLEKKIAKQEMELRS